MIVTDVETSGTNPYRHQILSIGAVEFENPENQFYGECRLMEGSEVEPAAMAVNGFTREQIADESKQTLAELLHEYIQWARPIGDRTVAGHNTGFDLGMLNGAARRVGMAGKPFGFTYLDMHNVTYVHMMQHNSKIPINRFGSFSIKADKVFKYVGMPEEPMPHHGLMGAKMEAEALHRLIYGKSALSEFVDYPVPETFAVGEEDGQISLL